MTLQELFDLFLSDKDSREAWEARQEYLNDKEWQQRTSADKDCFIASINTELVTTGTPFEKRAFINWVWKTLNVFDLYRDAVACMMDEHLPKLLKIADGSPSPFPVIEELDAYRVFMRCDFGDKLISALRRFPVPPTRSISEVLGINVVGNIDYIDSGFLPLFEYEPQPYGDNKSHILAALPNGPYLHIIGLRQGTYEDCVASAEGREGRGVTTATLFDTASVEGKLNRVHGTTGELIQGDPSRDITKHEHLLGGTWHPQTIIFTFDFNEAMKALLKNPIPPARLLEALYRIRIFTAEPGVLRDLLD